MPLADYDELRKIDVRPFCKKRDGLDYLNWATCIDLLRKNGASKVYWEPVPDPMTGSSLRRTDVEFRDKNGNTNRCYETLIKVVIDDNVYYMQTPVLNGANPVKDKGRRKERKNIKILTYLSIAPAISGRSWRHGMILNDTESNLYAS